jgi:hypothetical protein
MRLVSMACAPYKRQKSITNRITNRSTILSNLGDYTASITRSSDIPAPSETMMSRSWCWAMYNRGKFTSLFYVDTKYM